MIMHIVMRGIFDLEYVTAIVGHTMHFFKNQYRLGKNRLILEQNCQFLYAS